MRKKIYSILLTSFLVIIPSVSFAEKYSCAYMWNGNPESLNFERFGEFFLKSNTAKDKITYEDKNTIVLLDTFLWEGKSTSYHTLIDKTNLTFVMIALEYKNSTNLIEGKCDVY